MKFVSDKLEGVSPAMLMFVVGASLLGLVPVGYGLIDMYDPSLRWAEVLQIINHYGVVFLMLILIFAAMFLLFFNLKIEIKANAATIDARMIPIYEVISSDTFVRCKVLRDYKNRWDIEVWWSRL